MEKEHYYSHVPSTFVPSLIFIKKISSLKMETKGVSTYYPLKLSPNSMKNKKNTKTPSSVKLRGISNLNQTMRPEVGWRNGKWFTFKLDSEHRESGKKC